MTDDEVLDKLAAENDRICDEDGRRFERGQRGNMLDIQFIREMTYGLHAVSIGTHQLMYFAAMKYVKNHMEVDADTQEDALRSLAGIFDELGVGTLTVNDDDADHLLLRIEENALAFPEAVTERPICYFLAGYIAGFLECALDGHFVVNEVNCISQGEDACIFRAQRR